MLLYQPWAFSAYLRDSWHTQSFFFFFSIYSQPQNLDSGVFYTTGVKTGVEKIVNVCRKFNMFRNIGTWNSFNFNVKKVAKVAHPLREGLRAPGGSGPDPI